MPPTTPLLFLDENSLVLLEWTKLILIQKTCEGYTTEGKEVIHFAAEIVS